MDAEDGAMNHDPRDVETMARLYAIMDRANPDEIMPSGELFWTLFEENGWLGLDALQAKGWKITTRDTDYAVALPNGTAWAQMHDAAPICPREDKE